MHWIVGIKDFVTVYHSDVPHEKKFKCIPSMHYYRLS